MRLLKAICRDIVCVNNESMFVMVFKYDCILLPCCSAFSAVFEFAVNFLSLPPIFH